jgi:hypothetical protein
LRVGLDCESWSETEDSTESAPGDSDTAVVRLEGSLRSQQNVACTRALLQQMQSMRSAKREQTHHGRSII